MPPLVAPQMDVEGTKARESPEFVWSLRRMAVSVGRIREFLISPSEFGPKTATSPAELLLAEQFELVEAVRRRIRDRMPPYIIPFRLSLLEVPFTSASASTRKHKRKKHVRWTDATTLCHAI